MCVRVLYNEPGYTCLPCDEVSNKNHMRYTAEDQLQAIQFAGKNACFSVVCSQLNNSIWKYANSVACKGEKGKLI